MPDRESQKAALSKTLLERAWQERKTVAPNHRLPQGGKPGSILDDEG